jgi:hypothetical protein
MIEAKAFITCSRIYSPYKSELLSTNIKLTTHKDLIRSVMTHDCPTWKFFANTHLPYVYDCINYAGNKQKSCKIIKIFAILDKAKPDRKYKRFKLGGSQAHGL